MVKQVTQVLDYIIVQKIVKRYGGSIYVEDSKPKGSTFIIKLRKVLL